MAVVAERRLPGIRFERQAPEARLVLPRMDVAAFVGFAACGPLHTPVPVEDNLQFEAIFGGDASLAWDEEAGVQARGYLAPAVRAFFRNGGRRCWIVRAANEAAQYDWFEVPGLARLGPAGLEPALLRARSEGSWADALRVATALQASTLAVVGSTGSALVLASRADEIARGDLLRITGADHVLLFSVGSVAQELPASPPRAAGTPLLAVEPEPGSALWLLRAPPPEGSLGTALFRGDAGEQRFCDAVVGPLTDDGRLELDLHTVTPPREGSLLRLDLPGERLWVAVDEVRPAEAAASPAADALRVVGSHFRPLADPPAPPPMFGPGDLAEKLTFELWARRGPGASSRLADLGFAPGHPRFVGDLPTDLDLFRSREGEPYVAPPAIWQLAAEPRFPLAGPGDDSRVYVPFGIPLVPDRFVGPVAPDGAPLVRDGLVPFDDRLFLDDDVRLAGVETLLATADFLRFQANRPRTLRGIHSLVGIEEATIVAVPDAVQRDWSEAGQPGVPSPVASEPLRRPEWWRFLPCRPPAEPDPDALPISEHYLCAGRRLPDTPTLAAGEPVANGSYELSWTAVAEPDSVYVLEEAVDPAWSDATVAYRGQDLRRWLQGRLGRRYYRVRAEVEGGSSDWSNPVAVTAPSASERLVSEPERGHFLDCATRVLDAPVLLQPAPDGSGSFTVEWLPIPDPDAEYVLEEATDPAWRGAHERYRGRELFVQLYGRALGAYYYRVRAVVGDLSSDWSAGVTVLVAPATRWRRELADDYEPGTLLTVQRALLRLCAARGDLFAVLALPAHYREDEAVEHVRALTSTTFVEAAPTEERAFSFGAVYHPWLTAPEAREAAGYRVVPPDGAAAGVIAQRAETRGAWVAPANEPVRDVVLLAPRIRREQLARLQEAQINVVRQEPAGFLWLSADTLSPEPDLRPIGVRRLLSLLRRAALLNGSGYVFDTNDALLRRALQRGFEQLLSRLYVLGAFSGATAAEAFRVEIGSPPNSPVRRDRGELVVELKVAPSQPLAFLTVRLVQAGEGELTVESR